MFTQAGDHLFRIQWAFNCSHSGELHEAGSRPSSLRPQQRLGQPDVWSTRQFSAQTGRRNFREERTRTRPRWVQRTVDKRKQTCRGKKHTRPPPPHDDTLDKLRKAMEKKSRIVDEKAQVFSEAMELQRLRARQATSPDAVDEVADTAVADSTRALQRAQRALVKAKGLYSNAQELQRLRYTHGIRSYSITSHHITSHHSTLHHSITFTQQITSHHITSHYIASHLITSHPITSHLSTSQHTPSKHDSGLDGGDADSTDSSKGTSPSTPKAVPKRKGMSARAMSAGLYVMTPSNRSNAAKCYNCRKILSEQNCKLRVVHCSPWVDSTTGRTSPGNTNRTSFCLFGKGKKISTNCFNRLQRVPLRMDELSDEHGLTDEEQAELQKIAEGWNEIRPAAAPKRRRGAC